MRTCKRCGKSERTTAIHKHHPYRRGNNPDVTIDLCYVCHRWVHDNIAEAVKLGFMIEIDGVYRKRKAKKDKWKVDLSKRALYK